MVLKLKSVLLFVLGLAVATLIFEGLLRTVEQTFLWRVFPVAEGAFYGPDPLAGYTLRPGASGVWLKENRAKHKVNSHGMLDKEVDLKKDGFRVAVIGDSMTEALQVDRAATFVRKAQDGLMASGHKAEVLNFGLAGATPAVMAARLENVASKFSPDLTVFLVSMADFLSSEMGNDTVFAGYVSKDGTVQRGTSFQSSGAYTFRTSPIGELSYSLVGKIRVLSVLNSRKNEGLFGELSMAAKPAKNTPPPTAEGAGCLGERLADFWSLWVEKEPKDKWKRARAFFEDLEWQKREGKTKVVVAFLGTGDKCPKEAIQRLELIRTLSKAFPAIEIVDFQKMVLERLPKKGLSSDLRGFGTKTGHGHLNYFGHEVFGNALSALIGQHL